MKQVLENLKTGECQVVEVPAPVLRPGYVLVRNHYSVISTGTEAGTVKLGQMSLLGKARARPEQTRKVIQVARTQGALTAYRVAMRSLEIPVVLGYCSAGEVVELGEGVSEFKVGDWVACGGAGYANHAEVVCVPKNLCVKVPDSVELRHAAFSTLGAIALQGLRIADPKLGEHVVVIGLGLVGLISVQLLKAAGCTVFGIDIDPERVALAREMGVCEGALASTSNLVEQVKTFTGGRGADSIIVTAASNDNAPVALAGELARHKGRVVVVGRTEMSAPRETYLFKELELCTSLAYGPGTGDPSYEHDGVDYPVGYVRWTENRNMAAFIDLVDRKAIDLEMLITHEFDVREAEKGFELITGKSDERSTAVLLRYPVDQQRSISRGPVTLGLSNRTAPSRRANCVHVGVIGAGSFATNELLPLLVKHKEIQLRGIASATGVRARALGKKYGFPFCASDAQVVLDDDDTDCVFILTRHDSHASLACAALQAGKHVFVEKPLALNHDELSQVEAVQHETGLNLMVGFNRRYAPLAVKLREFFGQRAQPVSILYRANVGYRAPEHWLHDPQQGGGVILGEACHHIDFCNWLVDKPLSELGVKAMGGGGGTLISEDNVHITLGYADGSLATIAYLSNGCKAYNSERVEVYCDNKTAALTDYKSLELAKGLSIKRARQWLSSDKGHNGQIEDFLNAVRGVGGSSIDPELYFRSSRTAIDAASLCHVGERTSG